MKIDEIEKYFKGFKFPDEPIKLDECTEIRNPHIFIASHLNMLRGKNSREVKQPYFDRLDKLYNIFKK